MDVSLYWSGVFNVGRTNLFFYSNNKSDIEKAEELRTMFPDLFEFSFYKEEGIDKVIIAVKLGETTITLN